MRFVRDVLDVKSGDVTTVTAFEAVSGLSGGKDLFIFLGALNIQSTSSKASGRMFVCVPIFFSTPRGCEKASLGP